MKRDLFGEVPIYYLDEEQPTYSERIQELLAGRKIEIDRVALNHYLAFRCTSEEHTIVKGIKKIPPSIQIKYENKNNGEELLKYLEAAILPKVTKEQQGLFLSGGLDSSTILGIIKKNNPDSNLKTFSAGFSVAGHDERKEAKQTAEFFGTEHHEVELDGECLKKWPFIVSLFGEPMADPTKIPVYFLCKLASKHGCESIFVGEGGDENFASYSQYKFMRWRKYMKLVPLSVVKSTPKFLMNKFFKYTSELGDQAIVRFGLFCKAKNPGDSYQELISIFDSIERVDLLKSGNFKWFPLELNDVNAMVKADIKAIMSEDLLMKMYKNATQFNLRGIFPFLDKNLFEYTSSMKMGIRLKGKDILRKTMKGILPDFVFKRPKTRFFVPIHKWGIKDIFENVCTKEQTKEYFNYDYISRMIEKYDCSPLFYARQMFSLIDFIIWKRIFIDKEKHSNITL